jgi:hypothetical protein
MRWSSAQSQPIIQPVRQANRAEAAAEARNTEIPTRVTGIDNDGWQPGRD